MTLTELVQKYDAKKPSYYLPVYEKIFSPIRYREISILEIGIFMGNSLRTWEEYCPSAKIVGVDIERNEFEFSKRIICEFGDQSDPLFMRSVGKKHGPFDVIIDDGSHVPAHWHSSYAALFAEHVKLGGWYVIEDLKAPWHEGWDPAERHEVGRRLGEIAGPMIRQEARDIELVTIRPHLLVVKKYGGSDEKNSYPIV